MNQYKLMAGMLLASVSVAASADISWVSEPGKTTLDVLVTKGATDSQQLESKRVAYNQSLLGQSYQTPKNTGFVAESKQYWLDTNSQQLSKGLSIPLTSDTAIIRLNPLSLNNKSQPIEQQHIELSMNGQPIQVTTFANGQQLKAAGMTVSEQTIAMKVAAQPGTLQLKLTGISAGTEPYVVNVFEPESPYMLALSTTQQSHFSGVDPVVKVSMKDDLSARSLAVSEMEVRGYVSAPNGEKIQDLKFKANDDGMYQAIVTDLQGVPLVSGLWEVHTLVTATVDGQQVLRDASTAFAVSQSTAQFSQELSLAEGQLQLGVENALAGRYEIRGTLLGMDDQGTEQPIALLMTAQWLAVGDQQLAFDWPAEWVQDSGLSAPFKVVDIELRNQSLMVPVQQVPAGLRLNQIPEILQDFR